MKKFLFIFAAGILSASCQSDIWEHGTLTDWWGTSGSSAPQAAYDNQSQQGMVSTPKTEPMARYESDAERYRRNIVTKAMGDDYVVYEYADVRIDEVASLASHYCAETNPGKNAYLRDIYLTKNHKRRATFDCVNLASQ